MEQKNEKIKKLEERVEALEKRIKKLEESVEELKETKSTEPVFIGGKDKIPIRMIGPNEKNKKILRRL